MPDQTHATEPNESKTDQRLCLLKLEILPKLVETYFPTKTIHSATMKTLHNSDTFMADNPYVITIRTTDTPEVAAKFFVKITWPNEFARAMNRMDERYEREYLMYAECIPKLPETCRGLFPKFFGGQCGCGKDDYVVIEYLDGFQMARDPLFLSDEHIFLALRSLGQFHGAGYILKESNPQQFHEIVHQLQQLDRTDDFPSLSILLRATVQRGFSDVKRGTAYPRAILDKLEDDLRDGWKLFVDQRKPTEPLAVICHGDFNRNNIMFQYGDPRNPQPTAAKLIDWQFTTYCSPMVDFAFLIYMNTTRDQRNQVIGTKIHESQSNFDRYFHVYHATVLDTLNGAGVLTDANRERYSRGSFWREFKAHALCAYPTISFFAPYLTSGTGPTQSLEDEFLSFDYDNEEAHAREFCDELYPCEHVTECLEDIVERFYL